MSNARTKHAYYNTTRGVLAGRFDDEDLQEIVSILNKSHVAYLYNPDEARPEPMFLTRDNIFVGVQEIKAHIVDAAATD